MERTFSNKYESKTREELVGDLEESRAEIARLKNIIVGQQKILDVRKALPAKRDEEVRMERDDALKEELQENQRAPEALNENREIHVEELNTRNEELLDAHEALRKTEEEFRTIFDRAGVAIFMADAETGEIIDCNAKAEELIGRPREEIVGFHQTWLHPGEMAAESRDSFARNARRDSIANFETMVQHRDGRVIPVMINAARVTVNGRTVMLGLFLDITERKQAEEALRESEARYRALIDNSPLGVLTCDLEGNITSINPQILEIMGSKSSEFTMSVNLLNFEPMINFGLAEILRDCIMTGEGRVAEKSYTSYWGKSVYMRLHMTPLRDNMGQIYSVLWVMEDITERKKAEMALWESEEKFRTLADTAFGLIAVHQGDRFVYVNNHATVLTGYSKDELMKMDFWEIFAPESRELIKRLAKERLDGDAVPTNYETRILTKDGKTKWVNLSAGLFNYGGKPSIVATLFDITNAKNSEEALKNEKAQAELYLDLMGHDINNMHQIALGYLELAMDMPTGGEQVEFIDKSVEVLQRSTQLIRNVRKLQKLRDGVCRAQVVDVCKVVSDVQHEFGAVPNKLVMLNFNGCEHCFVLANELLHDVFANLVSNAIKHTGDRAEIVIDLDVINDNGCQYCRLFVEDNGPGIPYDFKAKIFDRTLNGTNNAKGMGLGLYLVKSLVDSYGGRVWVEDRIFGDHAQGARFVVMLPAAN